MEKQLAKLGRFDVALDDRSGAFMVLTGHFKMEGSGIGLGYLLDADFIIRFLKAVGVDNVRDLEGKSCWITLKDWSGPVVRIDPLHKDDGVPFDIEAWSAALKAGR